MLKLRFRTDEIRGFRRKVYSWRKLIKDLRWVWPVVGEALADHHAAVFDSQGADNLAFRARWPALAELTVLARERREQVSKIPPLDYMAPSEEGPAERVLHWSLRLRNSLASRSGTGDTVFKGTGRSLEWGTSTPYGPDHQYGGINRWGKMIPARPFLDYVGGPAIAIGVIEIALFARMRD